MTEEVDFTRSSFINESTHSLSPVRPAPPCPASKRSTCTAHVQRTEIASNSQAKEEKFKLQQEVEFISSLQTTPCSRLTWRQQWQGQQQPQ
jgi:hypothetical protein